jgi:hypothetical protein
MNWGEFIQEIANQKIPNDKCHKTFIGIFGECETIKKLSEKLEIEEKTIGGHLTEIYKYFEPECHDLQIKDGKGKKDILRKHLQTLYASQQDAGEISHLSPPINYPNIPIPIVGQSNKQDNYDPNFVGRESAIATLIAKLRGDCRVLILTGITGIGKTAFAGRLTGELLRNFAESIKINFDHYQNTDFASVAAFILTNSGEILTPEDRNDSQLLFNWIVTRLENNPYLLVIDSLEFILKGNGDFHDEYWEKFFNYLLSANSCKSRIIITSQDLPQELYIIGSRYATYWHCEPLKGFTDTEQLEFFQQAGLDVGTDLDKSDSRTYLKRIGAAYEGHPLALGVITGEIISHPFDGNIVAYWKKYGHEVEKVEQSQEEEKVKSDHDEIRLDRYTSSLQRAVKDRVEKTFKRLANDVPNAYFMLIFGSVYSYPVGENFYFNTLETLGLGEEDQYAVLNTLRDRYLIEEMIDDNDDYLFRQHNLIRTVALEHLKKSKNGK